MQTTRNTNYSHFLFALIPTAPSIFFGLIFIWQQGASSINVSFVFLMMLFSLVSGYFMWVWHTDQLDQQNSYQQKINLEELNKLMAYTLELEKLLLRVEPKIIEQVLAAKELTEQEISILIRRFSAMLEEIKQIFDFANQAIAEQEPESLDNLKNNAEKIRTEIDLVLEALQFQDRVSQILALVQDNLATVRETLEKIQQQGPERHQKMLKVEDMLTNIQTQYDTVKHRNNRSMTQHPADELTLF